LDRLTVTEAGPDALDVAFAGGGVAAEAATATVGSAVSPHHPFTRRLARLRVEPCAATEVKGALMRVLTRLHVQREFREFRDE
jgi:hypothetical protein